MTNITTLDDIPTTKARKTREFSRTHTAHIAQFLEATNMNASTLARKLGVGPSTVTNWLRNDDAPAWTTLALRGLSLQYAKHVEDEILLVRVPAAEGTVVRTMLDRFGCKVTSITGVLK